MDTNATTRGPNGRSQLVLNRNALIDLLGEDLLTIGLPYFGHELRSRPELLSILALYDQELGSLEPSFDHGSVQAALLDNYVLLRRHEAAALEGGLTGKADDPVGPQFVPRELCRLPPQTVCFFGAPIDTAIIPPFSPAHGPRTIRRSLAARDHAGYKLCDLGDIVRWPNDGLDIVGLRIAHLVNRILDASSRPLMIGGDHACTYYALSAIAERYAEFALIHLDAHTDLPLTHTPPRQTPLPLNHANVMGYALDLAPVAHLLQLGIRDAIGATAMDLPMVTTVAVSTFRSRPWIDVFTSPPSLPVYLSIDMDVLDPSVAPEVSTPLPDGLTLDEVDAILRKVFASRHVIGADIVEVCDTGNSANKAATAAASFTLQICDYLSRQ